MTDLLKIQQQFARHIFVKSDKKILNSTIYSDIEALERLNIYRSNVLGNFESILSSVFGVTKKILGDKNFDQLIKKYCQKFPSKSGDLNEFGTEFPKFLKSQKPLFLKDLAQLELLHHQSYFAKSDPEKFDLKKFKKLSAKNFSTLTFSLNSSCILFKSKFSVYSIWQKERNIKNCSKAEFAMIRGDSIFQLNEGEFLFLSLIQKKKNLYEIYKTLCKKKKSEVDIGSFVNHFIADGTIKKFEF